MTMKTDASYKAEIFRKDQYMVIASNRHLASIMAIKTESTEALMPGQVMARNTGTDLYEKFSAVSGGSFDSVCVLFAELSENEASGSSVMRGIFGGEVYKDMLVDYSAAAKTEMGAKEIVNAGGKEIVKF